MPHCGSCARYIPRTAQVLTREVEERDCSWDGQAYRLLVSTHPESRQVCAACAEAIDLEVAHWDCWGRLADRRVNRPEPNSTPERAMELLLEKAWLVFGEQEWESWTWEAREYAARDHTPRTVRLRYVDGAFRATTCQANGERRGGQLEGR